jgi:phosphoribosylformylglycinamidine synthase subunit PurL
VVGGNVSLYNEAPTGPIFPTPVIGMVGRLPDPSRAGRLAFGREGDVVALVGDMGGAALAGSELAKLRGAPVTGPLPALDEERVRAAHATVRELVRSGAARSAHDVAEGGIAVALAECCIAGGLGVTVSLPKGLAPFAEALGRAFIVSGPEEALRELLVIGRVGGSSLRLEDVLEVEVSRLAAARSGGLVKFL